MPTSASHKRRRTSCNPCSQRAKVEHFIGVDTHRNTNTAAVVEAATGAVVDHMQATSDAMGYKRYYAFGAKHAPGRRVWAIEGTGSFGVGLTTFLLEQGEWVVEIDRLSRPARRNGAKSDELDAVRAAREALSREPRLTSSTRRPQSRTRGATGTAPALVDSAG